MKFKKKSDPSISEFASDEEILKKYERESNTRVWKGIPAIVLKIFMALFSVYCICMTLFSTVLPEIRLTRFLAFIIVIGYLIYPVKKGNVKVNSIPWYDIVLMIVGAGCFMYFSQNALAIIKISTRIQPVHVVVGVLGILCLMELCRRCVGVPILVVAGALLIYAFYNQLSFNPVLYQALKNIIYKLFYTTSGVIGTPVSVCYTYIVLFIIFGAFLERTGISAFFIAFANRVAGWSSGGPAKVAVISSGLCGMVSGSSVGNTVTTGSVTIPMMKKTGYKPEFAAAVEAASSTGGQIMPPIMGAAAFLMAEYMDLPYAQVAAKALLPALLYFAGIFIAVHLEAKKMGLRGVDKSQLPKWSFLAKNCYLILPLILLVWMVASGARTMAYSAAVSIFAALVIGWVNFLITSASEQGISFGKALLSSLKKAGLTTVDALEAGAKGAVTVAVACAMAGIIAGCITVTGLASTLINAIVRAAGGATAIGLVLTMLCCIILGMGVPTTANYCIMASTTAPILIELGFPVIAAHFFVFYFGIVADITPPVALAAYAGSAIAKSNPMKTGINATKLAISAFIVPYIFAYSPEMLFVNVSGVLPVIQISVSALIGLFGIAAALNGYLFKKIPLVLRVIFAAAGICMMVPGTLTDIVGLVIIVLLVVFQKVTTKKEPETV